MKRRRLAADPTRGPPPQIGRWAIAAEGFAASPAATIGWRRLDFHRRVQSMLASSLLNQGWFQALLTLLLFAVVVGVSTYAVSKLYQYVALERCRRRVRRMFAAVLREDVDDQTKLDELHSWHDQYGRFMQGIAPQYRVASLPAVLWELQGELLSSGEQAFAKKYGVVPETAVLRRLRVCAEAE